MILSTFSTKRLAEKMTTLTQIIAVDFGRKMSSVLSTFSTKRLAEKIDDFDSNYCRVFRKKKRS
jgi:hypothetical protein